VETTEIPVGSQWVSNTNSEVVAVVEEVHADTRWVRVRVTFVDGSIALDLQNFLEGFSQVSPPPALTRAALELFYGRRISDQEWAEAAQRARASGQWTVV